MFLISKREHEMAIAIAQAYIIAEMNHPDYFDPGASATAAAFASYYEEALRQLNGDFPDDELT